MVRLTSLVTVALVSLASGAAGRAYVEHEAHSVRGLPADSVIRRASILEAPSRIAPKLLVRSLNGVSKRGGGDQCGIASLVQSAAENAKSSLESSQQSLESAIKGLTPANGFFVASKVNAALKSMHSALTSFKSQCGGAPPSPQPSPLPGQPGTPAECPPVEDVCDAVKDVFEGVHSCINVILEGCQSFKPLASFVEIQLEELDADLAEALSSLYSSVPGSLDILSSKLHSTAASLASAGLTSTSASLR